jgi:hypothetical protein
MSVVQSEERTHGPAEYGPWMTLVRWLIVAAFVGGIAKYVLASWNWPLLHDTTVIHYVSFLIDHGWAPYRQIGDMNMPGAYLFEGWALHFFGASDHGWRLYDFTLSAVAMASMISIGRRYDWLAGFVAGGVFVMVHAAGGAQSAGQRDQLMAVLLLAGYAFCFESVRRGMPWLMLFFGLACAMAASVKPTLLILGPALFVVVFLQLRREGRKATAYGLWTLAGYAVSSVIVIGFLVSHQSMSAFIFDLTHVLPHYATVGAATWPFLFRNTLQVPMFVYAGCAVLAAVLDRNWGDWECQGLLVGIAVGLLNFYGQHKGFGQHRYTTVAFMVMWGTIQIFLSLRGHGYGRYVAAAGLVFVVLVNIPRDLEWVNAQDTRNAFERSLERDLNAIGTAHLQGQVQCLDIVDGCLSALFHLKIVQNTGSTGDLLLFLPDASPVIDQARAHFMAEMQTAPPDFFVLSNQVFAGPRTFAKVDHWAPFADVLTRDYSVAIQREFGGATPTSHMGQDADVKAYRILVRHGVALPEGTFR